MLDVSAYTFEFIYKGTNFLEYCLLFRFVLRIQRTELW